VRALLISTYEMGRQPFGLASPAAWLRRAGAEVRCVDVTRQELDDRVIRSVQFVGFHLPMHTATRLAAPLIRRVRELNSAARICAYGLYAPLNADWLRRLGVDHVVGGEFEEELTAIAFARVAERRPGTRLPRLFFVTPDRSTLPPLARYATLQRPDGSRAVAGYTEASRGCRHQCRHCPIVPIYNGQFRVVQREVVIADVAAQVAAGAEHITFGDPDFFNGPTHAMRIVEELHRLYPQVTYDVTIKIEHLLRYRRLLSRLAATGCLFVTSAVESIDDSVLARLEKGHTRADFVRAVAECRASGLTLVPTFVAFHPWLTLDGYCELLHTIEELGLIDHVAPIQLAIRLLIPDQSPLLQLPEIRDRLVTFDEETLCHRWTHPDPEIDRLHAEVASLVGTRLTSDRRDLFDAIRGLAHSRAGHAPPVTRPARDRATIPYLNEPWYC
jgi:radical SAM superfamily enzyme YgiQ (UPF0313 family)